MTVLTKRLFLVTSLCLVCGCSGGGTTRPQLATVRGTVKLKGRPVALANIMFLPTAGGQSSSGETGPSGEYELFFRENEPGAQIGKHKVTISTIVLPEVGDDGKAKGGRAEMVPAHYNTNSTLENEVVAGENVIDFDLK